MIDLVDNKFGRLLVIGRMPNDKWGSHRWLCKCDCKNEKIIRGSDLLNGSTKSCGCLCREKVVERSTKHGNAQRGKISRTYVSWYNMIQRCTNTNRRDYKDYGGRGIAVCDRWRNSFENFLEDMGERPVGTSIDRANNNVGYWSENCRWSTVKQQQRNKNNNHSITHKGKTQCMTDWADEIGVSVSVIRWRLTNGWSIIDTLTTPIIKRRK